MRLKPAKGSSAAGSSDWIPLHMDQDEILIHRTDVFRAINPARFHRLRNALLDASEMQREFLDAELTKHST